MSGGTLTTKGLVTDGGAPPAVLLAPPSEPVTLESTTPHGTIMIIVPTAPNFCLMVAENITANLRVQQSSNLSTLSLYKRAFMIAYETDEIAVVKK